MENIDKELFNKTVTEFKMHFEDSENSRIIFSAPYGTGKSTFLKELFNAETQKTIFGKKKYNAFHLYPVNYSVASNEDIFKYLKYDLMYLLIEQGIQFEKTDFSYLTQLVGFSKKNAHTILSSLLLFVPKVGGDLLKVYEKFDNLKDKFLDGCKETEKAGDKGENVFDYLTKTQNTEGGLYEFDIYTQLINTVLNRIKDDEKGDALENVLIIDDLDRIDPAHIFRLFNVFAAHFDKEHTLNKFGFDKVVFVCDIQNIRNIFINQYGIEVDFNGYIDKFFSKTIFHFTNYYSLSNWLSKSFQIKHQETIFYPRDYDFISDILSSFIKINKINFRNLQKFKVRELSLNYQNEKRDYNRFFELNFSRIAMVLINIFGDASNLIYRLDEMIIYHETLSFPKFGNNPHKIDHYYREYIFPVMTHVHHNFNTNEFIYITETKESITMQLDSYDQYFYYIKYNNAFIGAHQYFWKHLKKSIEILEENSAV